MRHAPELEGDEPERHERRRRAAGEPPGEEIEDGRHGREHGEHREPGHLEARAEEPEECGREVEGARPRDVRHVAVHDLAGGQADAGGEDVPLVAAADGAEDERGMQHGGEEGEATGDRPIGGASGEVHGSDAQRDARAVAKRAPMLAAGPRGRNATRAALHAGRYGRGAPPIRRRVRAMQSPVRAWASQQKSRRPQEMRPACR